MLRRGAKLVSLEGDAEGSALIQHLQWDPLGSEVLHVDLLRIAADLLDRGVDAHAVSRAVMANYPVAKFQLLVRTLRHTRVECDDALVWLYLSREMIEQAGADDSDADGFVEYLRLRAGVRIVLLMIELDENHVRVSLRSEDSVSVRELALRWGGGGHVHAAGAVVEGSPENVAVQIVSETAAHLERSPVQKLSR